MAPSWPGWPLKFADRNEALAGEHGVAGGRSPRSLRSLGCSPLNTRSFGRRAKHSNARPTTIQMIRGSNWRSICSGNQARCRFATCTSPREKAGSMSGSNPLGPQTRRMRLVRHGTSVVLARTSRRYVKSRPGLPPSWKAFLCESRSSTAMGWGRSTFVRRWMGICDGSGRSRRRRRRLWMLPNLPLQTDGRVGRCAPSRTRR